VIAAVRRAPKSANEVQWDPKAGVLNASAFDGVDAVVHLAGAGIGDKRWSDDYKREILESRTLSTHLLATTMAALPNKPRVFLSGSAIGIYGMRGDEALDENATLGDGFLADVCKQWEAAAAPAVEAGIRTVYLRTGIVLSKNGGALKKQLSHCSRTSHQRRVCQRTWPSNISPRSSPHSVVWSEVVVRWRTC